ncbi:sensor histidine kinase [Gordonia liuliyuniae]|uniref:ATP-binding protein n=1 Tax=Gordonia liuliyuniae TaxID=2911517 RepID=A0ABS9IN60_9ACTN|nr:ATP-binding protein [Gordonia liuliyuniae]MCF8586985.1 ATP-binding protein [Gordonia liuliyuniae]
MSTIIAVGYVVYLIVTLPAMLVEANGVVAGWYPFVGTILAFGPGLALLAVRWARAPQHRALVTAIACPVGAVVAAGVWGLAGVGESAEPAVWMLDFVGLAAVAVAIVRPVREALLVLIVCKSTAAYTALAHSPGVDVGAMAREAVFGMLFTSAFVYVTSMVVRAGASLDASRSEAADLVAASVRNDELTRFDGLIHDHVISTLVAVGADRRDPRVVDLASSALARLDALAGHDGDDEQVSGTELVARIRTAIDSTVETVVHVDTSTASSFDSSTVRALSEAVGEAVRNSRTHAGADADVLVAIDVADGRVSVVVADDGIGFDPTGVATDRLGLRSSVRYRMDSVGGWSRVRSAPGRGTTVEVGWARP